MKNHKPPTFKDDGKRRILCSSCGGFLVELHLGERNTKRIICKRCKCAHEIFPPHKETDEANVKIFQFGIGDATRTYDLTEEDFEISI